MAKDEDYILSTQPEVFNFSKQFADVGPAKRFLKYLMDSEAKGSLVELEGEMVVHATPEGKQQIKALFWVDDRKISYLTLQRFNMPSGKPVKAASFTLTGEQIPKLIEFVAMIKNAKFPGQGRIRIQGANFNDYDLDRDAAFAFARGNLDVVASVAEHDVTERDITAFAYRKRQLEHFRKLVEDHAFFENEKGNGGAEAVWQKFFERNHWIFGYGLSYIFATALSGRKLEQIVAGASVKDAGKRIDALLKTRGRISSLCFVEIKTHQAPLLEEQTYRSQAWAVSRDVAGAIAQTQRSVQSAEEKLRESLELTDKEGNPTGEEVFLFRPRSIVVVGHLKQFETPNGVNAKKFASFELFRRQLQSPEIITFDELYERARFIVESTEESESIEDDDPW